MQRPNKIPCLVAAALALAVGVAVADVERIERGNLIIEGIPEIPSEVVSRLDQYQNTRGASFSGWMPDGGMLISTRFAETNQVHHVRQPVGARTQLTFLEEPVRGASVSPNLELRGFAYLYDRGGNEFTQLYWFDLEQGEHSLLTDGASRNSAPLWSNSGDRFAYTSTRRDGRNFDIWVGRPDQGHEAHELVFEASGLWFPIDWAPGDDRVLIGNYLSINEARMFVLDLASGDTIEVNRSEDRIGYGGGAFDADGDGVYLIHNQDSEFRRLHHHELQSGAMQVLSAEIPWDIEALAMSPDRKRMAISYNEDGFSQLVLRDLEAGADLVAPEVPLGLIGGLSFSHDGQRLALTLNTPRSPSDVHVYHLGERNLVRWTESEVGGLDPNRFPEPELVRFESFDELKIPAWVYRPQGTGPHPVIVQIHGGPEGQSRPNFSPLFAYWVNELGAAVVRPNVRGSSGYGKTFLDLDNGKLREDSVRDIGALLDWIGTQPDLDPERVVVYGGSYGGYMVLASLVHFDQRLLGGVNVVGISNFVTFLENTEAYRRDLRRAEYGDERDPAMREFMERISPLNNADRIKSPLFVAQGYNDPRVPWTESQQIVRTVRDNGGEVWYLLAMDEGHGFARKSNRDYFQAATVMFFRELFAGNSE